MSERSADGWAIHLPWYGVLASTTECTRRECLRRYMADMAPEADGLKWWRAMRRRGAKCVKVTVTTAEGDA